MWLLFWTLAPVHVAVPFAVRWLHGWAGFDATSYVVAGFHVVFPLLYLGIVRWLPSSALEQLMLLGLNHLVMAIVGGALWLAGAT
jgi:hypothetical protein